MRVHYVIRLRGVIQGFSPDEGSAQRLVECLEAAEPGVATAERRQGPMPSDPDAEAARLREQERAWDLTTGVFAVGGVRARATA